MASLPTKYVCPDVPFPKLTTMTNRKFHSLFFLLVAGLVVQVGAIYYPVREYKGGSFFDRWDFYGNVDDTTWGKYHAHLTFEIDMPTMFILMDG